MKFLTNLKLSRRLAIGFGLVLLFLLGITAVALTTMAEMDRRIGNIVEVNNKRVALAGEMIASVDEVSIAVRNLVIIAWVDELPAEALRLKKALARYDTAKMAFTELVISESRGSPARKQLQALEAVERDARTTTLQAGKLAVSEKKEEATTLVALDLRRAQSQWVKEIEELARLEGQRSDEAYASIKREFETSRATLISAAALATLVGLLAAILISRSVTVPVATAVAAAKRIAVGDFSQDITASQKDETGELLAALMTMQNSLRQLQEEVKERTQALEQSNQRLQTLAITDELTGAYNRRHFNDFCHKALKPRKRNDPLALCMFDIDYFKIFNDRYGHQGGDEALRKVANIVQADLKRSDDYLFRLGGEEFGILLTASSPELAEQFVAGLRQAVRNLNLPHVGNPSGVLTASFGVAWWDAASMRELTPDQMYVAADALLYEAKEKGRDQVVMRAFRFAEAD